jgi:hypothetical protein
MVRHVIKLKNACLPKMVFIAKPEGKRGVGRPRLRWLDDVEAGIKSLGAEGGKLKHKIEQSGRQL